MKINKRSQGKKVLKAKTILAVAKDSIAWSEIARYNIKRRELAEKCIMGDDLGAALKEWREFIDNTPDPAYKAEK